MTTQQQDLMGPQCLYLEQCDLIQKNKTSMPNLVERIQKYYCSKLTFQCARRLIYDILGVSFVPPLLLPNQWEWAKQIICEHEEEDALPEQEQDLNLTFDNHSSRHSQ